jgi:hypothetical protein
VESGLTGQWAYAASRPGEPWGVASLVQPSEWFQSPAARHVSLMEHAVADESAHVYEAGLVPSNPKVVNLYTDSFLPFARQVPAHSQASLCTFKPTPRQKPMRSRTEVADGKDIKSWRHVIAAPVWWIGAVFFLQGVPPFSTYTSCWARHIHRQAMRPLRLWSSWLSTTYVMARRRTCGFTPAVSAR